MMCNLSFRRNTSGAISEERTDIFFFVCSERRMGVRAFEGLQKWASKLSFSTLICGFWRGARGSPII